MAEQNNLTLTGLQSLPYYEVPAQLVLQKVDPIAANYNTLPYKNFQIGTFWLNTLNNNLWYLASIQTSPKVQGNWIQLSGGNSNIEELTGNNAVAVPPTANNINVIGDAYSITILGNAATSTLTASVIGGTNGQILIASSAGSPAWNNITAGTGIAISNLANGIEIAASGTSTLNFTSVTTTPYVVAATNDFLGVTTSALEITIELPNAPATGRVYTIKDSSGNAGTNNITVTTVGGAILIDGATTFVMNTAHEAINVLFDGTNYEVF